MSAILKTSTLKSVSLLKRETSYLLKWIDWKLIESISSSSVEQLWSCWDTCSNNNLIRSLRNPSPSGNSNSKSVKWQSQPSTRSLSSIISIPKGDSSRHVTSWRRVLAREWSVKLSTRSTPSYRCSKWDWRADSYPLKSPIWPVTRRSRIHLWLHRE